MKLQYKEFKVDAASLTSQSKKQTLYLNIFSYKKHKKHKIKQCFWLFEQFLTLSSLGIRNMQLTAVVLILCPSSSSVVTVDVADLQEGT